MTDTHSTHSGAARFGAILALVFLVVGFATLPGYGLTWDDGENLLTGAHYLRFFLTGDVIWLDFDHWDAVYAASDPPPVLYTPHFRHAERYPPVANMAAAATHELFTDRLGWLADTDGYHVSVLLFGSLAVFVVATFARQAFGVVGGWVAVLALVLYPLFIEHAHLNLKDVPFAALVVFALWTYWRAVITRRWAWGLLSAVATGLALGVRVLAAEIWGVIALATLPDAWAWLRRTAWLRRMARLRRDRTGRQRPMARPGAPDALTPHPDSGLLEARLPRAYAMLPLHVALALGIFLLSWPWLWPDPIGRLGAHLDYAAEAALGLRVLYGGEIAQAGVDLPWHYTLVTFLFTTPLLTLALGALGLGVAFTGLGPYRWARRRRMPPDAAPPTPLPPGRVRASASAARLLALTFLVALARTSWPSTAQYDGTRHMMDGIVAFAGLSGFGAAALWTWVRRRWPAFRPRPLIVVAVLIVMCLPFWLHVVRIHPYEGIYYNLLAGGVRGAAGEYSQAYWGSSFRAGAAWLNANVPADAVVLPRTGGNWAHLYVRPEIRRIADEELPLLPPDQVVYVAFITRVDKYDAVTAFADANLAPIYTVSRRGVPLLKVIRTDAATLLRGTGQ